jgi:hypothetical protein
MLHAIRAYSESVVFKWDQDPDPVHDKPEPQSCIGLCNPMVVHIFMHSPPKIAGGTLIKKENQIFLIYSIRKFRVEQLQSHI